MGEQTDIVKEIMADREKGTARLVAEYKERLYSAALSLCHDTHEAEDLVFCTIERVLAKIASYQERESFYEWMHVILLNIYRNSVRGKVERNTIPVGGPQEIDFLAEPQTAESVTKAVDGDMVRQFLEKMPCNMREVLILHYFMDMPVVQVAKFLALPVGTIKSRLHYARMTLAHRFGVVMKKTAAVLAAVFLLLALSAAVITNAKSGTLNGESEKSDRQPPTTSYQPPTTSYQPPTFDYQVEIQQGETAMTGKKAAAAALSAAMAAAPLVAANGDEYRFIISGDPVVASIEDSSSASSGTCSLIGGPLADGAVFESGLEARYRTMDESQARKLRSDKFKSIIISFK